MEVYYVVSVCKNAKATTTGICYYDWGEPRHIEELGTRKKNP
ncbi:MAG: hypothetical protein WBI82_07895 [Sphaerochaeta sp.]